MHRLNLAYKRRFDLALLAALFVPFAPLWAILVIVIAVAIRLEDGGGVFFVQWRVGFGGGHFNIIKFRTMTKGTGRETRVGAVLRRFRLDELPQIVNIARGEMSWVGPRPEQPGITARIERRTPSFRERLQVPPGLAGLAQLRGGYHTSARNKLRYDRLYMANMTPLLDLKLFALCVAKVVGLPALPRGRIRRKQGPRGGAGIVKKGPRHTAPRDTCAPVRSRAQDGNLQEHGLKEGNGHASEYAGREIDARVGHAAKRFLAG